MRLLLTCAAIVATVAAGSLATLGPSPARAANAPLDVTDNEFRPASARIVAGDTAVWTHRGANPHSITADDGSFDSHPNCQTPGLVGCMAGGQQYQRTFSQPGTVRYHCKIHGSPGGVGMSGVIEVVAPGSNTTAAPPPPPTAPPTTRATPTTRAPAPTTTTTLGPPTTADGPPITGDFAAPTLPEPVAQPAGPSTPGANAVARPFEPTGGGSSGNGPLIGFAVISLVVAALGVRMHRRFM